MRSTGELLMALVESGLTDAQKALVLELAALATAPVVSETRAAKSARNARYYQRQKEKAEAEKASETRLNKTTEPRLKAPETSEIKTPLAGATENNLTTTVIEPNLTSPNYDAPDRAILDLLECQLTDAVGVALASKAGAPKLFDLSPILGLLRSGDGPPCDLQADVLPTLRAAAARSSPGSIKTWAYFTGAIREARDRRLTGAPVIQINPQGQAHERAHAPSQKRATREGNHARAFQGALAAAVARQPG